MRQVDFRNGKISINILQTAAPMLVAQVLNLLYSIVDRIYIGRIPGEGTTALGGVGLCFPVIVIVTAFSNLFGMGGAPLCSMELGRGDNEQAQRIMNTAFMWELLTGLVLLLAGEVFARPMLYLFGATTGNISYALTYLRIYLLGTLFVMVSGGMNSYITAQGFSGAGMLTIAIGAGANIALDPIFIFVFRMGVAGAALATILSQALSAFFVWKFLTGRSVQLHLRLLSRREFRLALPLAGSIASLGTASFIMQLTNSLVSIVCNAMLSRYGGELYVSVMTIITSVRQVLDTPIGAIAEGSSPVISFNYGARKPRRVRKAIWIMVAACFVYTLVIWISIECVPSMYVRIFSEDASILDAALPALHLYFLTFVFQSLQYGAQTTFKALGCRKQAIFFSLFRKVILVVPLTLLLPGVFHFGTDGVFMAEPVSNVIGGLASFTTMCLTIMPRLRKMEQEGK